MAKKRTRKSRRRRSQTMPPATSTIPSPAASSPSQPAAVSHPRAGVARNTADFVQTYAYVYFDLRKMFFMAAVIFVLLILTNIILRYFVVV